MQNDYLIHIDGNKWLVGFEGGTPRFVAERPKYGVDLNTALEFANEYIFRFGLGMLTLSRVSNATL